MTAVSTNEWCTKSASDWNRWENGKKYSLTYVSKKTKRCTVCLRVSNSDHIHTKHFYWFIFQRAFISQDNIVYNSGFILTVLQRPHVSWSNFSCSALYFFTVLLITFVQWVENVSGSLGVFQRAFVMLSMIKPARWHSVAHHDCLPAM